MAHPAPVLIQNGCNTSSLTIGKRDLYKCEGLIQSNHEILLMAFLPEREKDTVEQALESHNEYCDHSKELH